ncbi:uncharacterized protein LOC110696721 [Chenopodium quinoa]|uniref:uncharacterized protein LOC110696721 n=1 Tax=Chenopodium quinoa TaxID=63459 RepID=UPI000B78CBCF|nr:uncharacterized protein LOC110696721 [Chenopodium quinoa]
MCTLWLRTGGLIGHRRLRGGPGKRSGSAEKVEWTDWIWSRYNIPKTSFIALLAILNKLRIRDTLFKHRISNTDRCLLCGNDIESLQHLFFDCAYSRRCLLVICDWLKIQEGRFNIISTWKHWKKEFKDPILRKIGFASLAALVYYLWSARNSFFKNQAMSIPKILCHKAGFDGAVDVFWFLCRLLSLSGSAGSCCS